MRRTTTGNSLSLSILFSSAPRALTIKCPRTKSKMKNNKMTHSSPIKKFGLSFITTMGLRKNWEWKGLRFDTSQRQRTLMFLPHTHVKLMEKKFWLCSFMSLKAIIFLMISCYISQWFITKDITYIWKEYVVQAFWVLVPFTYCADVTKPSELQ